MISNPAPRFSLRPYLQTDAAELSELYYESVQRLGGRRYSPEQVVAWAPAPVDAATVQARAGDGRTTLVAVDDRGRLLGYGDLEADGHIDHLYCRPEAAGTGVALTLLEALERLARDQGVERLYVEASELAKGLFERKGFTVSHRRDFEVRGVAIHNYAMERPLSTAS
ncbi:MULTISPECIES: N-acetyltransferase family protein [unclassified Phenylobacterium]|uniref:GNAT family N-acetyltransferase n=1 Tax=unclassified Phenylobacterium TaxID=2640670 RepID=UPI003F4F88D6